jgi:hypothetical protein
MSEVIWEELPQARGGRGESPNGKWAPILNQLKRRRGQWARIEVKDTAGQAASTAGNLRKRIVLVPDGVWEFASRKDPESNRGFVYARYMGESE